MLAPQIRMIRDRRVLRIHPTGRGIEKMKSFGRHARDDLSRHAAPGKCFADAEQPASARDRREHRIRVERFHGAQIDDFDFVALGAQFFRDRERFMQHRAVADDCKVPTWPDDSRLADRHFVFRQSVGFEVVIKIFVLAIDDGVVDRNRVDQHRVGVLHRCRRHHDHAGIMGVEPFHALAVERSAALRPARW